MDNKSYNIRVPKRWARIAMIVGVTAMIVAPLTALATHSFDDVPNSHTFHEDIEWMKASEVTRGCNPPANDRYCPDDDVTRAQMSAFMRRLAQYMGAEDGTPAQADNAATADHATTADNASNANDADTVDGFHANELIRAESTLGATLSLGTSGSGEAAETSLDAPVEGLLIMSATFEADLGNGFGDASADLQFVLNGSTTGPALRHAWDVDDEFNTVTVQYATPVDAGTSTVALQVTRVTGFVNIDNPVLTLQFVPFGGDGLTPAGSASSASEPGGSGPGDE